MKKSLHNRRKELAGEKNTSANLDGEKNHCLISVEPTKQSLVSPEVERVGKAFFGGVGEWRQIKPFLDRRGRLFFCNPPLCRGRERLPGTLPQTDDDDRFFSVKIPRLFHSMSAPPASSLVGCGLCVIVRSLLCGGVCVLRRGGGRGRRTAPGVSPPSPLPP